MGKQSKSNAKKEQRKLTQRRRAALEERLRAPRALQDCGAGFLQPALLRVGDLEISFEPTLSKPDLAACFDILEDNMKEQYEVNPWGWDPKMKRAELANDEARFVLVRDAENCIQAFAHFRFEVDDDDAPERAVLYVRELQVAEARRGSGIGRRVMGLLQLVGAKLELDCVLLTVFESNKGALAFYEAKLKYVLDRDDPSLFGREECYRLLSRALPKPKPLGEAN
jgi:ribosomal protein S18 acetylase RimI-like enzyme